MNLFELQENLKNFSQDQLVNEMRNPTGSAPQYLVLSELQRRRRIMQEEQAQMPQQASVAEEAVAAAGMPQGGLAQMAQAMAPQTDMTQNTAAQPVERMSEGGLSGVSPRLTDFMPIGPSSRRASGRGIPITPRQMGQSIYEDYIDEMRRREAERRGSAEGLDLSLTAMDINRRVNQGRYDDAEANPPTIGAEDIRRMANENRTNERIPDGLSILGAGIAGPYTSFLERMAETPLFPEREPEPLASIPADINRARFADIPTGTLPANEGRLRTPDSTYDEVMPFDRNVYGSDDPYALPADRGMRTDVSGPGFQTDVFISPEEFALGLGTTDTGGAIDALPEDLARIPDSTYDEVMAQRRNVYGSDDPYALPTDRAVRPVSGPGYQTRDVFIPADEFELGMGTTDFGGNDPYSLPAEIILEQERERLAEQFQTEAEAADAETAALDRAALAAQFEAEGEVADAEARLPVVDLTAQREGAGGGGGGAGGAGGAGGEMSGDDLYEQDKWLALAQFGLGLMGSQAPTLGQAIGEAGATGIAALRQAREDRQGRIEAAQARADRLAAAAARASSDEDAYPYRQIDDIIGLADAYQNQANSIVESLGGVPTESDPEYEDYINSLARANTYRDYARQAIGIQ